MDARPACQGDATEISEIHVASWKEAYSGLLAPEDLARISVERRAAFWSAEIKEARTRVALIEGVGFAAAGRQRDTAMIKQGFAEELYALYVRSAAYGLGAGLRLFASVLPEAGPGFTATVLDGNARAIRFYERQGGTVIGTLEEQRPGGIIRERIYGWPAGRGGLA